MEYVYGWGLQKLSQFDHLSCPVIMGYKGGNTRVKGGGCAGGGGMGGGGWEIPNPALKGIPHMEPLNDMCSPPSGARGTGQEVIDLTGRDNLQGLWSKRCAPI